ncbi:MAG: CPBP family intramembrane metalloprotease, partial [Phycisphaerae bacterium]|nr:CPBP family intramembrane metalloprotease [Phycisphaerae bacterium]
GALIEIGMGIATYLAFLPAMAVLFIITTQLINLSGQTPTHPIIKLFAGPPRTLVMIYLLASVVAPILEETMFRGALFHHLRGRNGWWLSALLVSLIFAIIHPQGWTLVPVLGGLSMQFCFLREWRGSLIASMTAHALNNGIVATLGILLLR